MALQETLEIAVQTSSIVRKIHALKMLIVRTWLMALIVYATLDILEMVSPTALMLMNA